MVRKMYIETKQFTVKPNPNQAKTITSIYNKAKAFEVPLTKYDTFHLYAVINDLYQR